MTYRELKMPDRVQRLRQLSPEKRALLLQALRQEAVEKGGTGAIPRRSTEAPAPASFAQQRLWLLDQLVPGSPEYNLSFAVRLSGRLDAFALERSLGEVVRRHEVLSTALASGTEGTLLVPAPAGPPAFAEVDLSGLAETVREAATRQLARSDAQRPFDLTLGPLMRATLLRLEARANVLLFCLHHAVSDGWSNEILLREVAALYAAFTAGEPSPLAELPIQYADFAVWQHQRLTGKTLERLLAYWRRQLGDAPPVLELAADRPRPTSPTHLGGTVSLALAADTGRAVRQLGRELEATPFVILLAAFKILLGRQAGRRDVVVGSPVAGRERPEVEGLIGLFANTLVLYTDLSGDPSFADVVSRVGRVVLEAQEHAELPFERLVEELRPERDESVNPLFQVVLALKVGAPKSAELPGLTLEPVAPEEIHSGIAKFDLTLFVDLDSPGRELWLEYSRELFAATTAARLLRHLRALLEGALARPRTLLPELPWLAAGERHQLLVEWRSPAGTTDSGATVHGLFRARARAAPDAIAVASPDGGLSHRELDRRGEQLAGTLRAMDLGPARTVGVVMERSFELVTALVAILKAGGAYVPLDPSYPTERLALMMADSGVRVLLTQEHHLPALGELPDDGARILTVGFRGRSPLPSDPPPRPVADSASPDDLAYVIYTSGSTGRPKGVAVSHRAVVRLVRRASYVHLGSEEVVMQFAPIAFDASTLEIWGPLLNGARLALVPPGALSLAELGRAIGRLRITTVWLAAGLFHQMVDAEAAALGGLRQLLAGGDVLSVPHCRRFLEAVPGCRLINGYGPTENTTFTCCHPMVAAGQASSPIPIGRPISGTRVYVLSAALRPLPVGVSGELCAGGDGVARGYAGQAALTAERFVPELFGPRPGSRMYKTGDRARYLADGTVEFLGRGDHQVKVRGFRIEPEEIEMALAEQPEVLRSAVVACADSGGHGGGDNQLVAFVVPSADSAADGSALFSRLKRALGEVLPGYMVPTLWLALPELPLNANGKVDRSALHRQVLEASEGELQKRAAPVARDPVSEMLGGIWTDVLGVEPASVDDNFFDLGGHSLLATRIVARVREAFDIDLPLAILFEKPTVGELAAEIEVWRREGRAADVAPLLPVEGRGRSALSFAQERLWVLDRFEPGSPAFNISVSVLLRGALDPRLLERAFAGVVDRHEILRTTFGAEDGEPFQRVQPALELPLPVVDLTALEEGARQRHMALRSREVAATSFALARGPLLRLLLLATAPGEHALLLAIHHIISDGWSMGLLVEELATTYAALDRGVVRELPPLTLQYADFAVWQRRQEEMLERQVGYWRERLGGAPRAFELPTDHPRPGVRTYRGARAALRLEPSLRAALVALARQRGATLFMVLLAAFKILLWRLSGERDVVVGAPIAGRGTSGVEGLMGIFLNTLVLRTDLGGGPTFVELLGRVRETALGAYAHQDVPFEKLLEELRPERDLSRTPFFQVFFNMLNLPRPALVLADLEFETLEPPEIPAKFDLTVYAEELGQEIRIDLVYNTDLFRAQRMAELLRQYHGLLRQVAEAPEQSIDAFSLRTPESRGVLPDPQQALGDAWQGAVHELFARRARRDPGSPAVVAMEMSWTYTELEGLANRLAQRLCAGGVVAGDVVAIYGRRDPRLVLAVLAVLKAGAAFVILDPAYPGERLIECLRLAAPAGWIEMPMGTSGPTPAETLPEDVAETLPPDLAAYLQALPPLCWVSLGPASSVAECLAPWPARDPEVAVGPESLAYIAFTSGSTGTPKGILGRHGPLTHFTPWQQEEFGLSATDRFSMLSGIAHDPLQRDLFTPLQIGGAICIPDPSLIPQPGRLAEWMKRAEITVAHLTPAMGQVLTEVAADRAAVRLDRLRYAFLVGDILTRRDVARLRRLAPDLTCVNFFGSTETQRAVGHVIIPPIKDSSPGGGAESLGGRGVVEKAVLPLGRGIRNVQLLVLNSVGALSGIGEIGEIYVRSPHLARGYLGDPAGTAERFLPAGGGAGERLYRTGDLGRYLPTGEVEFAGRADHQIKVRGFRIEPGEIERLIDLHPAVRDSVVVARDVAGREKQLVAYVAADVDTVRREEVTQELRTQLKGRLPDYMVPAAFVLLDKLPLTPNGKIDRVALGRLGLSESNRGGDYAAPRTETERAIAAVLREVLGVEEVGLKDSFFELGGDSLKMVRVQSRLSEVFGRDIQVVQLFTHPTVTELAGLLGSGGRRPDPRRATDRSDELRSGKSRRRLRFEKMRRKT